MAGWTGLEPAASAVTGRRYNQLNYHPARVPHLECFISNVSRNTFIRIEAVSVNKIFGKKWLALKLFA